ncbi:MAG: carboxypeptidase-like regulatory domain-containing protein [Ignavibacteriales bacterium]|nr:carboxypeptidase-like regulatory domain-containing protein [Ignavibacteriales bacterium]
MNQPIKFLFRDFSKAFFIFLLLFASESFSQNFYTLEGKVTDAKTNEPLTYVNVFLSQTTIGATTDLNGIYKIGKIPGGNYILVASMVGYESNVIAVDLTKSQNKVVNFSLERTTYEFKQIEVQGEIPQKWLDQLEIFKKMLFGSNIYAKKCVIKNPYQIDFKEEGSKLTATAREPIIIRNNALGYKIECVLKNFTYDINNMGTSYQIYPSFTELTATTADSAEEYLSARKDVYLGSLAQLLSSLAINNYKFRDEGFELYVDGQLVKRANEIIQVDSVHQKYFLNVNDCLLVKYWDLGKQTSSRICLTAGITEFDPSGFLINPDEFILRGAFAHEGIATMLPRFWKPEEK